MKFALMTIIYRLTQNHNGKPHSYFRTYRNLAKNIYLSIHINFIYTFKVIFLIRGGGGVSHLNGMFRICQANDLD